MKAFLKSTFLFCLLATNTILFAQSNGDFRSRATGNWSSTGSWQSYNGTAWVNASSTPSSSSGTITILNSHTITITTSVSADQLVINSGGQLTVNSGQTLTIPNGAGTDLTVIGTLSNAGTITQSSSTADFNSGSKYIHSQNGGSIISATWNDGSNLEVSGMTSTYPSSMSQSFFNVTFNSNSTSSLNMDHNLTCRGNLTLANTGGGSMRFASGVTNYTATIGGNLIHSSADEFRQSNGNGTGNFTVAGNFSKTAAGIYKITSGQGSSTLTINGNLTVSAGTLDFSDDNNGTGTLYVKGDFSQTGGTITETGSSTSAEIIFNGTTAQTFSYTGGTVSGTINYTVTNGAILAMSAASTNVYGNGFTLSSGATLDIKSADGITKFVSAAADSSKGNIRTLNRSYTTNASYIYSGAGQTVGNGLTGARNLTLSGSGTKTFAAANFTTNNLGVSVDLNINTGVVASIPNGNNIAVSQKLYLGGTGKANGSYGSTTSSATNKTNTFFAATTGTVTATLSALPVTLSSFTAKPTTDNKVSLAWVTSTEQVNKGFRIERQAGNENGKFEQIGFVGSKAKDGNSQNTLTYNFIDAAPKVGAASFYRLVQEDLDGKLTYTEVRVVKLNGQSVSVVFPNPSNGAVNISRTADGKKMNIQVIDQSGKIISQVNNITDANYRMNISQSGIYSIKMMYPETGEQSIQRVVVQK